MSKVQAYLDERLGIAGLREFAAHKTVPVHKHSMWYYWGGITLLCYVVQVVSGIALMVYYQPGHHAYESVRMITYNLPFGHFIRSIHAWSSTAFLASAFIHMFSVFFMKAYRKPREFGWWTGIILLLMGLGFGFSGYLMPMDDLGFFATKVGMAMVDNVPVIGHTIGNLMRGGLEVGDYTVQRFFALHAVILPMLFLPILGLHLWVVQKHGMALPPGEEAKPEAARKTMPFFPNFLIKDCIMWLIALNILAILAWNYPWSLGHQADALSPAPVGIHPEWYFMSAFQVLKVIGHYMPGSAGEAVGMILFTLGLVLWILIPLYDVKTNTGRRARVATYFGLAAFGILVVTSIWGYAVL